MPQSTRIIPQCAERPAREVPPELLPCYVTVGDIFLQRNVAPNALLIVRRAWVKTGITDSDTLSYLRGLTSVSDFLRMAPSAQGCELMLDRAPAHLARHLHAYMWKAPMRWYRAAHLGITVSGEALMTGMRLWWDNDYKGFMHYIDAHVSWSVTIHKTRIAVSSKYTIRNAIYLYWYLGIGSVSSATLIDTQWA